MSSEVCNIITFYQKSIRKARNNEPELLHCISKLFELPVTIDHLQKTGVGKTVNSLRKYGGKIGIAAKTLVSKWKTMVSEDNLTMKINESIRGHYNDERKLNINKLTPHVNIVKESVRENTTVFSTTLENMFKSYNQKSSEENMLKLGGTDKLNTTENETSCRKGVTKSLNGPIESRQVKRKTKMLLDGEVDSSMGASFSDALGMCNETNFKLKKTRKFNLKGTAVNQSILQPHPELRENVADPIIPFHFDQNIAIRSTSRNTEKIHSPINKSVSLSIDISSKTTRTKVFSGIKPGAVLALPSLFDMCIKVLQKNIEALEYTGGVPFDVLKPLLQRITPQQLMIFEHYNGYLIEDSDILWKQHVNRYYRNEVKNNIESWREMFLRCEDEKERRLHILTKNIKQSQTGHQPVRTTRLTYLDRLGKPPPKRGQLKIIRPGTTESHVLPTRLDSNCSSVRRNTKNFLTSSRNGITRANKAPLMVKTLQFFKKKYKK